MPNLPWTTSPFEASMRRNSCSIRMWMRFEKALDLTENRFQGGLASREDVELATTQLEQTRAQDIDITSARDQFEHAIAVLIGQPASTFDLSAAPMPAVPPTTPPGLPSELLERRPDIAGAERQVAAANAQIGIARAAYFPLITLGLVGGFESGAFTSLADRAQRALVGWRLCASNRFRRRTAAGDFRSGQSHLR